MNRIINGLYWNHNFKGLHSHLFDEQNLSTSESFERLANKLFLLNQEGVKERYPNDKSDFAAIDKFKWDSNQVSDVQCLKSMQCLCYQACEGNVPETSKLYKWLEKACNAMALHIVNKMPEYEKAEWS